MQPNPSYRTLVEPDLINPQLLGDLLRMLPSKACAAHVHASQRLAQLHPRRAARLATELHDLAYLRNLAKCRSGWRTSGQPARKTLSGAPSAIGNKVPPQVIGQEWHDRRDHPQARHEREPEGPERRVVVGVEAPP